MSVAGPVAATCDLVGPCPGCGRSIQAGSQVVFERVGWPSGPYPATGPYACVWHATCSVDASLEWEDVL